MCWCTPGIKTPRCKRIQCAPPGTFSNLPDWQQRVIEEKGQLDEKFDKLQAFFGSLAFAQLADEDRSLLHSQRNWMEGYSDVLRRRIERFLAAKEQQS
jgi:hypothetical protein